MSLCLALLFAVIAINWWQGWKPFKHPLQMPGRAAANTPFQPFTASAGDRAADRSSMRARAAERPLGGSHQQPWIGFRAASAKVSPPSISLMMAVKAGPLLPMAGSPAGIKGDMDIAYLSTLSALAGSVVGGLTWGVATWLSQRAQARESQLAREMARRDDLYKEFIAAYRRHTVKPL